jgi:hypothetical protein
MKKTFPLRPVHFVAFARIGAAGLDFDEYVLLATRSMEVDGLAAADGALLGDGKAPLAQAVGDDELPVLVLRTVVA